MDLGRSSHAVHFLYTNCTIEHSFCPRVLYCPLLSCEVSQSFVHSVVFLAAKETKGTKCLSNRLPEIKSKVYWDFQLSGIVGNWHPVEDESKTEDSKDGSSTWCSAPNSWQIESAAGQIKTDERFEAPLNASSNMYPCRHTACTRPTHHKSQFTRTDQPNR